MLVTVRPATERDLPALTRLDLTYPTDRVLALVCSGQPPEHTFTLRLAKPRARADGGLRDLTLYVCLGDRSGRTGGSTSMRSSRTS